MRTHFVIWEQRETSLNLIRNVMLRMYACVFFYHCSMNFGPANTTSSSISCVYVKYQFSYLRSYAEFGERINRICDMLACTMTFDTLLFTFVCVSMSHAFISEKNSKTEEMAKNDFDNGLFLRSSFLPLCYVCASVCFFLSNREKSQAWIV